MKFYKYEGVKNDFIIMEGRRNIDIKKICDRHCGVGADGVIFIDGIHDNAIEIKIYNSDGSEASTCGNGLRCVGAYLRRKLNKDIFNIKTISGRYKVKYVNEDDYEVEFDIPKQIIKEEDCYVVYCGNKHVITTKNIALLDFVDEIKARYEANIETAEIIDKNNLYLKIYERGVGETLGCGSATIAATYALYKDNLINSEINCISEGGCIKVKVKSDHVLLTGNAHFIFKGEYDA